MEAALADGFRNQLPSNWAGTGPPGGVDGDGVGLATGDELGAADGVDRIAEEVDWPHDEPRKTIARASSTAIAGEPIQRWVVMPVRPRSQHTSLQCWESQDSYPLKLPLSPSD